MEHLEYLTASELGRMVNERKIKPTEVISYFKERIEERNPSINAFVYTKFEYAMEEAERIERLLDEGKEVGPFAGVPFALKDFLMDKPGWTSSHGGVKCLITTDTVESVFCHAMEEAGGIAVGKCNAPSYGFRGTTDNPLYGVTKNPFNLLYNPGGSSGGSAAAVSDGLVSIAEGGDAGGSIRIPSNFCNLFGFKAGIGTIPSVCRPDAFSATHPYCFNGGVTKSVEDTAVLLNYMNKYDPLDPYSRISDTDYLKEMNKPVSGMKIAYTVDFDLFPVEDKVKEKFLETLEIFKKIGVSVEPVYFDFKHTLNEMAFEWCKGITIDCAIELNLEKSKGNDLLKDHKEDFPSEFIYWKNVCDSMGIMDMYEFNLVRTEVLDQFEKVFRDYDFILSPVVCVESILNKDDHNTKGPDMVSGVKVESLIGWCETFLSNFTGHPAASVPAGLYENNIPYGIQITGKRFHDGDVLALSHAFEVLHPWRENFKISMERKMKD